MNGYPLSSFRGDLFGGLTAGIVALPLALAFGVASGAGAAAGLYGAIALGFIAALLGGTRCQISGPTGPMTVVFASAIAAFGGSFEMALAVVLVGGILQIVMGMMKTGGLVNFIPYPVVSGFMSGVGIIIMCLQIAPLLGAPPSPSPLIALSQLPETVELLNQEALILGIMTLSIVLFTPVNISRLIPSPLLALIFCTLFSRFAGFEVPVIGAIPTGLPEFHLPQFTLEQWSLIFTLGLTLALLGSIDSLLTSLVADSITQTRHQPNRELIGQGLGNILCSFIGGLPGAGATMRTVVNVKSGGKTRLSGIIHSLLLLGILLGLGPLAAEIPLAVLAGILIKVGMDILDYRMLRMLKTAPRPEILIMSVVFFLTVFVDLVMAVGVGVVLAMGLLTLRVSQKANIRFTDDNGDRSHDLEQLGSGVRVVRVKGPLFFGSTSQMLDRIDLVDKMLATQGIVIDCRKIEFMDLTAVFALDDMVKRLEQQGLRPKVVATPAFREQLLKINTPHLTDELIFTKLKTALNGSSLKK